ncbi:hypothetical protein ACO0E1_00825 [Curtobacterium sp. RRHDQ66]|uniref:hypothetical protein n=1 Tax=Curtobacterium guangdongense TaxID=3413380 RepID=UPI003BF07708
MTNTHPRTSPIPGHVPEGLIISTAEALREAADVYAASGLAPIVHKMQAMTPGPRRKLSFRTLILLSIAYKSQVPKRDYLLMDLARWANTLNAAQRDRVGLPPTWKYHQLQTAFKALCALLEPENSDRRVGPDGVVFNPRRPDLIGLDHFANALVGAAARLPGWRGALPPTAVQAIDSTDIESHARVHAWRKTPDSLDEYRPDDAKAGEEWSDDAKHWPKTGMDGRLIVSADSQARTGWRTRTQTRDVNAFNGYDAHLIVDAGNPGLRFWVPLIRGMLVRPAGSYKAAAGLDLLDSLHGGIRFTHLTADRGYSYAKPDAWANPLAARGLIYVHDLHTAQRRPHPSMSMAGVFWLDGSLFPDALPNRLRKLPSFKARMSIDEQDKLHALYDERAQWAFVANRRYDNGDVQYKGPARAGHIRCANYGPSQRLAAHVPRSRCTPGTACACAATKVIPSTESAWERQRYPYGSTKWATYYGLRNLVESQNAQLKYWRGSMRRHSTMLFGTTANTLVLAFNCIAVNLSMLRDAYGETDPTALDYTTDLVPRRRRAPKTTPRHLRGTGAARHRAGQPT